MNKASSLVKNIAAFNPEKIKVLVFDVDDTLTRGSMEIKIKVLKKLFYDNLDRLQEAREIYEFTGKGDRYNIIAHVIDEPQDDCSVNKKVEVLANKFELMTQEAIREQGIHADDLNLLVYLKDNFSGPIYLLSATPKASVVNNIKYFESIYPEISGMFTGVIGNPMDNGKAGELSKIAKSNNVFISEVVMIGDGGSDYNGALGSGSQFIGITAGKEGAWANEPFPKVNYLSDIKSLFNFR